MCDIDDICQDNDDNVDTDLDGIPDGCDFCPLDSENDADNDGICESDELSGCIDVLACNYNESATEDDQSCVYSTDLDECATCSGEVDGTGNIIDNDS